MTTWPSPDATAVDTLTGGLRRRTGVPRRGAPIPLLLPALVGLAFLVLPLVALLIRAPWRSMPSC